MYRDGAEYNRLDKMAIDIYIDYGITDFPIDVKDVCRRLGVSLVPYSEYTGADLAVLRKKSIHGFFAKETKMNPPTIFFNDDLSVVQSHGAIRQTILHETKHYVDEDYDEEADDDDKAEHFGRYFSAPTPFLVIKGFTHPNEIISRFGVTASIANNIASSIRNRMAKYGDMIFDYERPLIELLDRAYYDRWLR